MNARPSLAAPPTPSSAVEERRRRVMLTVFLGTFLAPLDASIVNIALPTLARQFAAPISSVQWVVMAYLLTTSSLLLSAGRLGDIVGYRRIYLAGFALFTGASALCGLAPGLSSLIGFRVLQALGGTCLLAAGPALLTEAYPPERRGRALGMLGISVATGLTAGPFLGGWLTQTVGWRWIFLVNVPVGIGVLVYALGALPPSPGRERQPFDVPGSALAVAGMTSLLLALGRGGVWGWVSPRTLAAFITAAVTMTLFLIVEKRAAHPMLDLSLLGIRLFAAANASAMANYVAVFTLMFLTPFLLMEVRGMAPREAGLVLTAVPLATGLMAPLAGALSDRIGSRLLSTAGLVLVAAGLFGMAGSPGRGLSWIVVCLLIIGLGSGIFQTPNTAAIMGAVPRGRIGIASGMQATMRNLGMVLGVAMAGAILATMAPAGAADDHFAAALRGGYLAGGAAALLGAGASLVRGTHRPPA